jgi:hypothetical protein
MRPCVSRLVSAPAAQCIGSNHSLANDTPRLFNTPLPIVQGSSGNLGAGFECLEEFYPYKQLLRRSTGSADQCKGMPCHGGSGLGVLLCSAIVQMVDDGTVYCSNNVFGSKPGRTVSYCDPPPRLAPRHWFPIWNRPMFCPLPQRAHNAALASSRPSPAATTHSMATANAQV